MNINISGKIFNEAELAAYVKTLEDKIKELEIKVEAMAKEIEGKAKAAETKLAKWVHGKLITLGKDEKEIAAFAVKVWDGAEAHIKAAVQEVIASAKPKPVAPQPVAPVAPVAPAPAMLIVFVVLVVVISQ